MQLSIEEWVALDAAFAVDSEGWLVRRTRRGRGSPGRVCLSAGYPRVTWRGKHRLGHHIAWALYYGEWPDPALEVDHIDRHRWNCSRGNLRQVDRSMNMHNTVAHKDARSQVKGVDYCPKRAGNKWRARICFNYKTKQIGYFSTEAEAAAALKRFKEGLCTK